MLALENLLGRNYFYVKIEGDVLSLFKPLKISH